MLVTCKLTPNTSIWERRWRSIRRAESNHGRSIILYWSKSAKFNHSRCVHCWVTKRRRSRLSHCITQKTNRQQCSSIVLNVPKIHVYFSNYFRYAQYRLEPGEYWKMLYSEGHNLLFCCKSLVEKFDHQRYLLWWVLVVLWTTCGVCAVVPVN